MNMITYNKAQLARVARKYQLQFVILHGSYATGRSYKGSDLDIAVLGTKELTFGQQLKLHGALAEIFGDHPKRDLDFKTLHKVDPLFRFEVVRDGILLYGDPLAYEEFKASVYHAYEDARPLRDLEKVLVEKYQRHLHHIARAYASS